MSCTPFKAGRVGLREPWTRPDPYIITSDPGVVTETEDGDDFDGSAVTEEG